MHKPIDQQTNALASLTLTTPKEQSTTPKLAQPSRIVPQQVDEDSDDVIYTNHFPCSFANNLSFYQYDVIVEEYHEKQNKYINISSREKRRRFVCDMLLDKTVHPTAVCWYDEGNCIYSTTDFKDKCPMIHEREEQGYQRRLTIKSLSDTRSTNELDQSSIRIIETLIKQVLKDQFKAIGSVFYRWDEKPDQDGPYDLLTGFRQAVCLTESGPTLNVDTTITRFYPEVDLLTFIWERLLQNKSPCHEFLSDRQYDQIGNRLKDIEVTTVQSDYQNRYVLTGNFSDLPRKIFMEGRGHLLDYYKDLGFELHYPKLYCLKAHSAGNPQNLVDLPIELCYLREWQMVKEDENTKPVPAPPVSKRYDSILGAIRSCNFHDDKLCKEIQLEVSCEAMMPVPYETLRKRQITLSRQGAFTNPIPIHKMAFIYLAERQQPNAKQVQKKLLNNFYDAANWQRMELPKYHDEYEIFANRNLKSELRNCLSELKSKQCQFILCLENCRDPGVHELFKQIACIEFGLVTQCANFTKVQRIANLRKYCGNLLKSVNAKLSGENKQVAQLQTSIKTMFIGADVLHPKNNYSGELPSIAAVVASMNSECTLTNQRICRQWPIKWKQSEEAILLLKEMTEELLIAFKDSNNGSLPEHVVVYRDGVDDGQLKRVQDEEVAALMNAFQVIYPTNVSSPLLTFIVVKKRHHTRLFRLLSSTDITNVESGVVVDTSIVNSNPNYLNFLLNSHEPGLGTNRIGNYVVLTNGIGYSLSELEELTYSLCHIDQRIDDRLSESIPSVLHLADAAASKARQLFDNNTRPPNGNRAEILRVHEHMQDAPNMF
ncbi:unnamed protein product [Rotaria socialis]|uniref:Uncharacterized protein n=1 Tax=Rotaria socialis TaxID=392032 RepID=A0A817TKZ1_9BILA|nr:unnamed protein product [Rotaria socialis]CAF4238326.1 unnamed protein product [Rotaria socialis]